MQISQMAVTKGRTEINKIALATAQ